jgi:hypothetical protein
MSDPVRPVRSARVARRGVIWGGDVLGVAEPGGVLADFDFALASVDAGQVAMVTYQRALCDWAAAAPAVQSVSARTTAPSSGRRSTLPVFTVPVMMASSSGDQNANAPQTP